MTAALAVLAIGLSAASGFVALLFDRRTLTGQRIACAILSLAAMLGIIAALRTVLAIEPARALEMGWPLPGAAFSLEVDEISAVFLIQVFVLGMLGSIYGLRYWRQSEHEEDGQKLTCFYGLAVAGMALVVVAKNAMLFLAGWEVMAVSAFFLVSTEDRLPEVRDAGFLYLTSTRVGTIGLIAMFSLLGATLGSFTFGPPPSTAAPAVLDAIFLLALFGFGLKSGTMPLHIWLPSAHANAPSHVSAVMSGVVIKMGIYGLVRITSFFATPPLWWGALILFFGVVSGVLGVAFALAQHDMKRLLAYHSVENIGIIEIGLGLAVMGRSLGRGDLVELGIAGALLHVVNHGLFKALLFLSAGSVIHSTGTRSIDRLGGISKMMPKTALLFLAGAVAISGLPPLNGFISELFVYLGLFRAATTRGADFLWSIGVALAVPALAMIGALALACFVKVFGAVFLGAPRSSFAEGAHDPKAAMLGPMSVLAIACAAIGLWPAGVAPMLERAALAFAPEIGRGVGAVEPLESIAPLGVLTACGLALAGLIASFALVLRFRLARAPRRAGPTWDCGYAAPTVRMQYTAASFAEMLVKLFGAVLRPKTHRPDDLPLFPESEKFESHVGDVVLERWVAPGAIALGRLFSWFRWLQRGSIHAYLLYILITVFLLHFIR